MDHRKCCNAICTEEVSERGVCARRVVGAKTIVYKIKKVLRGFRIVLNEFVIAKLGSVVLKLPI